MKYIDTEKLITIIEERKAQQDQWIDSYYDPINHGISQELTEILSIIDSLQQEQDSIAERFARIVRGNLIGIDKEVQQKFEQLYFEITGTKMYGGFND